MTLDIRDVINRPEYKWLEPYKDRLIFLVFGGSHAYGTNLPSSDIDIRGVMFPTVEELIGLNSFEQKTEDETDTVIYEFNKFIKLIMNSNPNTIEMLGCRENQTLIFSPIGYELIKNIDKFISQKAVFSFGGYAVAQLRRLENALCHDAYDADDKEKHILQTLQVIRERNLINNERFANKIDVKIKDKEIHVNIKEGDYNLRELNAALNEFGTVARGFDKLNNRNRKKDELHLNKHAMHLLRLYLMLVDILEGSGVITYREKDIPFLMKIRNGEINLLDKKSEFWSELKRLEAKVAELKENNSLPSKPNFKWIENFVIQANSAVVNNKGIYPMCSPRLISELTR